MSKTSNENRFAQFRKADRNWSDGWKLIHLVSACERDEIGHFWRVCLLLFYLLLRKCIEVKKSLLRVAAAAIDIICNVQLFIAIKRASLDAMRNGALVDDSENRNCNSVDNGRWDCVNASCAFVSHRLRRNSFVHQSSVFTLDDYHECSCSMHPDWGDS